MGMGGPQNLLAFNFSPAQWGENLELDLII